MLTIDDDSSTPSLTTSEETNTSATDLLLSPSPRRPPVDLPFMAKSKGKQRAVPRDILAARLPPSHPKSTLTYGSTHAFVRTWTQPRILRFLLSTLAWADFHAVSRTCKDLRHLFHDPALKDVALSRFLPTYRSRSPEDPDDDVRVSLADLEALMLCQSLPLHRYPMHAVRIVTAERAISPSAQAFSDRLVRFTQAHSRFVLLLRSRALPWQVGSGFDDLSFQQTLSLTGLRELTFPAPLSYFDPSIQKSPPVPPPELKSKRSKRRPIDAVPQSSPRADTLPNLTKRRLSVFIRSRDRVPLPEPQSSPPSIRYYSSFSRASRRKSMSITDDESGPTFIHHSRFMTDTLTPPRFPFASPKMSSSNSSLGSYPRSVPPPLQPSLSPHDLSNALIRTRAPILRVFVPCSILFASIPEAEAQLFASGLWTHLRPGDIVCNLGYVPEDSDSARGWLIYTGEELYPFFPPAPPPVPDAKALPSPLYYSHLLSPVENPRIVLVLPRGMRMVLHLALLSSSAPSPHSRTGLVRVKRYSWLGRLRVREEETEALGLGEGWAGDWVLEAEGTKEGRQTLVNAIEENEERAAEREWLVVREKSGVGRIWLRVISEQHIVDL